MDAIPGLLMRFSTENKNLLAFISLNESGSVSSNALVYIPGLTDGMMAVSYLPPLHNALTKLDYSLVQINISSSYNQFGFNSLEQDKTELDELFQFLKKKYNFGKILACGHSTGCQDILYYLRYGSTPSLVDGVILQAAVSDRDGLVVMETTQPMIAEAKELVSQGRDQQLLSLRYDDVAPISAQRFLSLAGRLTPDDMFSVDLTEDELRPILSPVKVPILLCFSEEDEYVPDKTLQEQLAKRMVSVLKATSPQVELIYIPNADHSLSTNYDKFIESVVKFVKTFSNQ